MALSKLELGFAAVLLDLAATEFFNHGCNDFPVENTDGNWEYAKREMAYMQNEKEAARMERPEPGQSICLHNASMMRYLAHRLEVESRT